MSKVCPVKPEFAAHARGTGESYAGQYAASVRDPEVLPGRLSVHGRDWSWTPTQTKDVSRDPHDEHIHGQDKDVLNMGSHCLDRHLDIAEDRPGSPDDTSTLADPSVGDRLAGVRLSH